MTLQCEGPTDFTLNNRRYHQHVVQHRSRTYREMIERALEVTRAYKVPRKVANDFEETINWHKSFSVDISFK